jgi:valyl-tRNA synthetase
MAKLSKSKGGNAMPPAEMIRRYSADAVRYWAASTAPGKDAVISEEKIQQGARLVTKLWNVARFAEPFICGAIPADALASATPADRWILARLDQLVERVTAAFEDYEYALAKAEIESFFWGDLADNYLEMAKLRLYDAEHPAHLAAAAALKSVLQSLLKLFAPLLPYITDALWSELFAEETGVASVHNSAWPELRVREAALQAEDLALGPLLVAISTAVRRYKSERALSLGSELLRLDLVTTDAALAEVLRASAPDLKSITRARSIEVTAELDSGLVRLPIEGTPVKLGIQEG